MFLYHSTDFLPGIIPDTSTLEKLYGKETKDAFFNLTMMGFEPADKDYMRIKNRIRIVY